MKLFDAKLVIAGAGGFAREVLMCIQDVITASSLPYHLADVVRFMVDDESYAHHAKSIHGVEVIAQSQFSPHEAQVIIAIGSSTVRQRISEELPPATSYATLIHPTANISPWVTMGEGAVITSGCIITADISLGKQAQINLQTTIGHDCNIGDFCTTAPGVRINGNCRVGNRVYFGTNAILRQGITICDDVVIGMGAVVLKDITEAGTYVGLPARKLGS